MNYIDYSFVSGLGCGICLGLPFIAYKRFMPMVKALKKLSTNGNYKLALIVRTDLNMTKGKIASQCGHAAISTYQTASKLDPETLNTWLNLGQTKITLKCDSLKEMERIECVASELGLCTSVVRDAGRTQVESGAATVLAVGPAPKVLIDKVTGHLKLL